LGKRRAKRSRKVLDGRRQENRPSSSLASAARPKGKAAPPTGHVERRSFAITDGHVTAGYVEQTDDRFEAFTADGQSFGIHPTLKAASRAIPAPRSPQ
jgi:hypothetical protein